MLEALLSRFIIYYLLLIIVIMIMYLNGLRSFFICIHNINISWKIEIILQNKTNNTTYIMLMIYILFIKILCF